MCAVRSFQAYQKNGRQSAFIGITTITRASGAPIYMYLTIFINLQRRQYMVKPADPPCLFQLHFVAFVVPAHRDPPAYGAEQIEFGYGPFIVGHRIFNRILNRVMTIMFDAHSATQAEVGLQFRDRSRSTI